MNTQTNTKSLDNLANGIRERLKKLAGNENNQDVRSDVMDDICQLVSTACNDDDFVNKHLPARKAGEADREVLYQDGESGFCICGHVYAKAAHGKAHDHGPSWAIYGQADGVTEMTDWKIIDSPDADVDSGNSAKKDRFNLVEPVRTYTMKRGDVKLYDVGDVHSPSRSKPVKLIRIEGTNLDHVKRSLIRERDIQ